MVNAALAACLLLFLVPIVLHLDDVTTGKRVLLVALSVPFVLLTLVCGLSAARPGSLGRLARRARPRS